MLLVKRFRTALRGEDLVTAQSARAFGGRPKKPFHIIEILLRQKWKIAILGSAVFLLLSPIAFLFYDTYYVATATVRISPTMTTFFSPKEDINITSYYHDYARTQVRRITRLQVLMTAINRLPQELRSHFIGKDETLLEAASRLRDTLTVNQIPRTHLISVKLKGDQPEGLAEVVNNVVNVYLEKIAEEGQGVDNHRLAYLKQERSELETKLNKTNEALKQISISTGVTDFIQGEQTSYNRLTQLQQAHIAARTATMQTKNALENAVKEADAVAAIQLEATVEKETSTDPLLANARLWSQSAMRDLRTRMLGFTTENPERKHLNTRIEGVQGLLADVEENIKTKTYESVKKRQNLGTEQQLIHARFAYETALKNESDIAQELATAKKETATFSQAIMQGRELQFELERQQELLQKLEQRIYSLQVESKAPGRTSLDSIARSVPHNNLVKYLVAIFVLSFGGSVLFFVVRESKDQMICTPLDVEQAIGAPPSWPIQNYTPASGKNTPFSRISLEDSSSKSAMAIRSLAVKINKERCNFGARLAIFTGVNREMGTTAIALNCAHAMRQLCDKVLLIDMNAQHPRIERLIRKNENSKGKNILAAVNEEIPLQECILHDEERDIDVLAGPPQGGLAALNRGKLIELLASLRAKYNFILVDTAPLVNSDLTEFMIIQSDLVIPIILGNQTPYQEAYDTVKLMVRLETRAIAPVLNWMKGTKNPTATAKKRKKRARPLLNCRPLVRMRVQRRERLKEKDLYL